MEWNQKLAQRRKQRGYSQQSIADALGISQPSYGAYELGKTYPSLDKLVSMSRLLDLSLDWLIDEEHDQPPAPELTDRERMLIERIRRRGIDPGEVLDLILDAAAAGVLAASQGQARESVPPVLIREPGDPIEDPDSLPAIEPPPQRPPKTFTPLGSKKIMPPDQVAALKRRMDRDRERKDRKKKQAEREQQKKER